MAGQKRTPRDHERSIRALRRVALVIANEVETTPYRQAEFDSRESYRLWVFQKQARAAAFSIAADFLNGITGVLERAAGKKRRGSRG